LKWRKEYPGGGTIYKPLQGAIHYPYFNRRRGGPAVHSFEYYLQKTETEAAAAKKVCLSSQYNELIHLSGPTTQEVSSSVLSSQLFLFEIIIQEKKKKKKEAKLMKQPGGGGDDLNLSFLQRRKADEKVCD
jgi:hypothetical protein